MWECTKCGERHEDSFEVCWNCGTALDGTEDPNFRRADGGPIAAPAETPEEPIAEQPHRGFSDPAARTIARDQVIITTTPAVEGRRIVSYCGLVSGQAIVRANALRHFLASFSDLGTGRSSAHETELRSARDAAVSQLEEEAHARGANAIIGVDLDYQFLGENDPMLLVSASGTAVVLE
jgi:uncharacterized protein YbjQ (UPF0145 family)